MRSFTLHLQDSAHTENITGVTSFTGEDKSGSFSLQAGHERLMTSLVFGLSRYRTSDNAEQYVAMPGALAYFHDNELFISTRRYLRGSNFEHINDLLNAQLLKEEDSLHSMKTSLDRMENEMLKRLWQMGRSKGGMQ